MTTIDNRPPTKVGEVSGGYGGDLDVTVHHVSDSTGYLSIQGTDDIADQIVEVPAWAVGELAGILLAAIARFSSAELGDEPAEGGVR